MPLRTIGGGILERKPLPQTLTEPVRQCKDRVIAQQTDDIPCAIKDGLAMTAATEMLIDPR
jgi:hypothetical protein